MALPEGLDTPFFEKVAFYMDTLDQLVDFKEMRQLYLDQARTNAGHALRVNSEVLDPAKIKEALDEIEKFQDWEFWNYIIVNMMLFWMLKKSIGPNASDEAFHTCHHLMYSYDIYRRRNLIAEGKIPAPLFSEDDLDS